MLDHRRALFASFVGFLVCVGCSSTGSDEIPDEPGAGTSGSAGSSTAGSNTAGSNAAGASTAGSSTAGSNTGGSNASGGSAGRGGASAGQGGAQASGGRGGQGGGAAGTQQAGQSSGGTAGAMQGGNAGSAQGGGGGTAQGGTAGEDGKGGAPASNAPADIFAFYCFDCHGERGAGTILAPEIQHPVRDYSNWVVRHGLPGTGFRDPMEAIEPEVLSDEILDTVFAWLDEPPQPTTGEGLYLDYCGNCHGADGQGGPTMRAITNELRELKTIVREGAHLGDFGNRREYMPAYPTTRLTDAEVDLIYDYVDSL